MTITLDTNGLRLNGQTLPIYSGAVHYWRLERSKWPLILDQVRALGFHIIETYIPWSVHETAPGQFDWGQADERKDVEAFLKLCEERGLWLLVRPGPLINAELTDFGFPEWVLLNPAVQARTAVGSLHFDAAWGLHPPHQFPVPSYASEAFYQAVAGWFDAVCPILARHLAPQGCILAVQSDNETCYLFDDQAYATDYSPDSLRLYRRFLAERYGSLERLNAAHHRAYASFSDVEPPRDCEAQSRNDIARHLDWVIYKEYQVQWSVARLARMLRERGLGGVPIFHDVASQASTRLDVVAMEADPDIDWVGINLYCNREDYPLAARTARYLAGATALPFVPELGAGLWSHHARTFLPEEHAFITLSTLMHGLKAFNLYMLVERERWQGSPITRHGTLRPEYARFYQELTRFLHGYRFWEYRRACEVLVLYNFDAARYAALASTGHYAHVDLFGLPPELLDVDLDLGLRWDPRLESRIQPGSWLEAVTAWLNAQHIGYDHGDTHLCAERLSRYALVCLPSVDFLAPDAQKELVKYVRAGGRLLLGPGMPYLDPALNAYVELGNYLTAPGAVDLGAGRLVWAPTRRVAPALADLAPQPEITCDHPAIDLALHRRGQQRLLFAANPLAHPADFTLFFAGRLSLKDAWGRAATLAGEGSLSMSLPAYTVGVWEVLP